MKKLLLSLLLLSTFSAWAQSSEFTIRGEIDNAYDGQTVFLTNDDDDDIPPDSTVVQNGRFAFSGAENGQDMYMLSVEPEKQAKRSVFLILEKGEIAVRLDSVSTVGGTPLNDKLQEYARIRQTEGMTSDAMIRFISENSANKVGRVAFIHAYQGWTDLQVNQILSTTDESFRNDEKVKLCLRSREIIKSLKQGAVVRAQKVGTKYTDFELVTPSGETRRLSDYVGKSEYLLIDFWASWCGPCIAGMPFIREQYEKYKDRGLNVIGISVDKQEDRDAWLWSLENRIDVPWDQLGYLHGARSDLAEAFVVEDIPYAVIIDKEGTMVEMLRMPDRSLVPALEKIFK